ncbi:hypothetical protein CALCODRAFT_512572 [Calocera cornea HHB12733]|uniref:Protein kinase domain-containing protein n=1 Tax=Calocera cornea HHB12733 TaxID=1353952 RepID=A0A165CXQ1_9BASI|nr:hypothetical protein CALCODRAFT_512572 [Calocera cornea HHB12733]
MLRLLSGPSANKSCLPMLRPVIGRRMASPSSWPIGNTSEPPTLPSPPPPGAPSDLPESSPPQSPSPDPPSPRQPLPSPLLPRGEMLFRQPAVRPDPQWSFMDLLQTPLPPIEDGFGTTKKNNPQSRVPTPDDLEIPKAHRLRNVVFSRTLGQVGHLATQVWREVDTRYARIPLDELVDVKRFMSAFCRTVVAGNNEPASSHYVNRHILEPTCHLISLSTNFPILADYAYGFAPGKRLAIDAVIRPKCSDDPLLSNNQKSILALFVGELKSRITLNCLHEWWVRVVLRLHGLLSQTGKATSRQLRDAALCFRKEKVDLNTEIPDKTPIGIDPPVRRLSKEEVKRAKGKVKSTEKEGKSAKKEGDTSSSGSSTSSEHDKSASDETDPAWQKSSNSEWYEFASGLKGPVAFWQRPHIQIQTYMTYSGIDIAVFMSETKVFVVSLVGNGEQWVGLDIVDTLNEVTDPSTFEERLLLTVQGAAFLSLVRNRHGRLKQVWDEMLPDMQDSLLRNYELVAKQLGSPSSDLPASPPKTAKKRNKIEGKGEDEGEGKGERVDAAKGGLDGFGSTALDTKACHPRNGLTDNGAATANEKGEEEDVKANSKGEASANGGAIQMKHSLPTHTAPLKIRTGLGAPTQRPKIGPPFARGTRETLRHLVTVTHQGRPKGTSDSLPVPVPVKVKWSVHPRLTEGRLHVEDFIHETRAGAVHRGTWEAEDVLIKVASTAAARCSMGHEMDIYGSLVTVWEAAVAQPIGWFAGSPNHYFVTRFSGEPLIGKLPAGLEESDLRHQVWKALQLIHGCCISHENLRYDHLLYNAKDRSIKLADFEDAVEHLCNGHCLELKKFNPDARSTADQWMMHREMLESFTRWKH